MHLKENKVDQRKPESVPLSAEALDFSPGLLSIQESPPARLPRVVMYMVSILFAFLLLWSIFGKLDIVASAEGHLVPQTYVKIVQPADSGIVQEILVREGQHVEAGQVLLRMDTQDARADESTLTTQIALRSLQLHRIDAELGNTTFQKQAVDPQDLFQQVYAQYREHSLGYTTALAEAQDSYTRAQRDYDAGKEVLAKLREVTPILQQQADAYTDMGRQGYVAQLQVNDKQREYLEKARDLRAQESTLASLHAAARVAKRQIEQVSAKYRTDLQNERVEAQGQFRKLQQDWIKQVHKSGLLELRSPQAGIAKDLATHTVGTVVTPGTVLVLLVPDREPLIAEVMVKNEDIGFVYPTQKVKIKMASYPFQQYGMLDGQVMNISADASESNTPSTSDKNGAQKTQPPTGQVYKALISLDAQQLRAHNKGYKLVPGMQVVAEINEGQRSVMRYLLSPLQKTVQESGRER